MLGWQWLLMFIQLCLSMMVKKCIWLFMHKKCGIMYQSWFVTINHCKVLIISGGYALSTSFASDEATNMEGINNFTARIVQQVQNQYSPSKKLTVTDHYSWWFSINLGAIWAWRTVHRIKPRSPAGCGKCQPWQSWISCCLVYHLGISIGGCSWSWRGIPTFL